MTLEEVGQLIHSAKTPQEYARAWKARDVYLEEPAEDEALIDGGEMLMMIELGLKEDARKEPVTSCLLTER